MTGILLVRHLTFLKRNHLLLPFFLFSFLFIGIPFLLTVGHSLIGGTKSLEVVDETFLWAFIRSIGLAIGTTLICALIAYSFCSILLEQKPFKRKLMFCLATSPIFSTFLIKVIGLKTCFDLVNGQINSTYGLIYVLIGLSFLYTPFAILVVWEGFNSIPKNLIYSAEDLGCNAWQKFFRVMIPNTKRSALSLVVIVLLPALTTVAVGEFLNHNSSDILLGELLNTYGKNAGGIQVAKSRVSTLALLTGVFVAGLFCVVKGVTKLNIRFFRSVR